MKFIIKLTSLIVVSLLILTSCSSSKDSDDDVKIEVNDDGYLVVNGEETEYRAEPEIKVKNGYLYVNGEKTKYKTETEPEIEVKDGYLYVNGEKTGHKIEGTVINPDGSIDLPIVDIDWGDNQKLLIGKISDMLDTSRPTRSFVRTKETVGDTVLNGEYTLITGTSDGKAAATYDSAQDRPLSADYISYVTEYTHKEYLEGYGVRVDGGDWSPNEPNFAAEKSIISFNLTSNIISDLQYDETSGILTFIIAADKTAEAFKQEIPADVSVLIANDGEHITNILLSYTIPASGQTDEISVEIQAIYSYEQELLSILP